MTAALISTLVFGNKLRIARWIGLILLVAGLVVVSVGSSMVREDRVQAPNPMLGNILIVSSKLLGACQVREHDE